MTDQIQRIGAYGIAVLSGRLLLSRISPLGYPSGFWNLPGGRIEHGEAPTDTLVREFGEETGLRIAAYELVDVTSTHLVRPGRNGAMEDFHGLAVMYRVEVGGDTSASGTPGTLNEGDVDDDVRPAPHVVEVAGTTDAVAWVPLEDVRALDRLTIVDHALIHITGA